MMVVADPRSFVFDREGLLTLEEEEIVENPIGQKMKVGPVSCDEVEKFFKAYASRKSSKD
jgi:hypothetical protein